MQVKPLEASSEKATTPRYDTIVICGATSQTIPQEVAGGEVVAWSLGHALAAMDALEEFVDDMADGNCHQPAHLTQGAADALNLMRRRTVLGWDADDTTQDSPADWKAAVARAKASAKHVFGEDNDDAMQAVEYMSALLLASEPVVPSASWSSIKPTIPGAYYVRGFRVGEDDYPPALVEVDYSLRGHLVCNIHENNSNDDRRQWWVLDNCSDLFEWLGPIAPIGGL